MKLVLLWEISFSSILFLSVGLITFITTFKLQFLLYCETSFLGINNKN